MRSPFVAETRWGGTGRGGRGVVGRGGGLMLLDRATEMLSTLAGCSSPRRVASTAGVCVCVCGKGGGRDTQIINEPLSP